jgi:hypothetical protein
MPCLKSSTNGGATGVGPASGGGYATEADCLNACKEGACCEGTTCSVKPACQCQGAGKVFKGVGTVCGTGACLACIDALRSLPEAFTVTISELTDPGLADFSGTHTLARFSISPGGERASYFKQIGFMRRILTSVLCGDDFQYETSVSVGSFNPIRLFGRGALVSRAASDGCYQESFGLSGDAGSGNARVECNPLP